MTSQADHITPTRLGPHPPWWYLLFRQFVRIVARVLFRVRVVGAENIPDGNYIVIANHLSWADPFLLLTVLPPAPRLYFIGPLQALNQGWKGWMVRTFDVMIAFERGAAWVGKDMLKTSLLVLQKGAVLGLFPEGHLGPREGELEPLQRGIGHLVLKANCPVLPFALSGVQELYLRKPITVVIGKPFRVAAEGYGRHAEVDAAIARITDELRGLIPPYIEHKPRIKVWRRLTYLLDRTSPQ
jgi:1-acyl-sn-glycerol-3-phosphate acyltransferase